MSMKLPPSTPQTIKQMSVINLRKEKVINLAKERGIFGEKAQVALAIDVSGSMKSLYDNGTVQRVLERLIPIALQFDDNQSIDVFPFSDGGDEAGTLELSNLEGFAKTHIMKYGWGGTNYSPVMELIRDNSPYGSRTTVAAPAKKQGFFDRLFGGSQVEEPKAVTATTPTGGKRYPTYVIFITDGDNFDKPQTESLIRQLSSQPIFFQFVGIGSAGFHFLNKIDELSGREVDNAAFFVANDIDSMTDDTLYSELLKEFPGWFKEMQRRGKID